MEYNEKNRICEEYFTCLIKQQCFGIPMKYVDEILELQKMSSLVNDSNNALGTLSFEGKEIPVFHLSTCLLMPEGRHTKQACIIVITLQEQTLGLLIEEMDEIVSICEDEIVSVPQPLKERMPALDAIAKLKDRMILIVNPYFIKK